MRPRLATDPHRRGLALAAATALAAGDLTAALSQHAHAYTALPAHVYAPYYETYLAPNTASISATAQASGAKYLTLAFLQSAGKGSCSLDWNGLASQPLSYFSQIAADYESVITTLGVTRLDMDVEAKSLNNTAGINRRNQAIAMTESWAASNGIPLQIQYTVPVEQYGLDPNGESVLQNAVADGAAVTSVNIMVFDYYIGGEGTVDMGQAAVNAATNTHTQLAAIYPSLSSAQLWNMEAMTLLPGIDDYPKKTEVTSLADAQTMLSFAQANNMNLLSIWAIQRDNGGCPGTRDSNTCSGVTQNTWDFSHVLEAITG